MMISHHNAALVIALALALAPEIQPTRLARVSNLVSSALGDGTCTANSAATKSTDRYSRVRSAVAAFGRHESSLSESGALGSGGGRIPPNELVYGELSLPVLATILDAVGVQEGDVFLDVGSGDGALVLGVSLLYARSSSRACKNAIKRAVGIEIVPGLVDRSKQHTRNLDKLLDATASSADGDGVINELRNHQAEVEFLLGDVHTAESDERMSSLLADTTFAVCFATTWSAGNAKKDYGEQSILVQTKGPAPRKSPTSSTSLQGRKLPKLSSALSKLSQGARVVIIDGKLNESDGFDWQGDLRIKCPDTAPYSVASLYHKR